MIGDTLPRATRDGTSPTGLSGSRGEPQGVGATSSGGSYSTVMLCIHPVQGPGANGPVAGGPPGRYYGPENPDHLDDDQVRKGVNDRLRFFRATQLVLCEHVLFEVIFECVVGASRSS